MKSPSKNFALQAFVPSYSFAGAVTGTRLKVFSFVSEKFFGVCKTVTTMLKYVEPSRTILSGLDKISGPSDHH